MKLKKKPASALLQYKIKSKRRKLCLLIVQEEEEKK